MRFLTKLTLGILIGLLLSNKQIKKILNELRNK